MRLHQLVLALMIPGLLLAGCGGSDTPTPLAPSPTGPPATTVPATATQQAAATPAGTPAGTPGPTATWPADAAAAIVKAQQAVAQQAKVAPVAVTVVSVTEHSWPTPALGCPQEGHAYIQVITPGYIIVLRAGTATYTYNADQKGNVATCAPNT